jgi:hypothetical protein
MRVQMEDVHAPRKAKRQLAFVHARAGCYRERIRRTVAKKKKPPGESDLERLEMIKKLVVIFPSSSD